MQTNRGSQPYSKRQIDYVYEVPLLSSLKQLLSDAFILEEVQLVEIYIDMHMKLVHSGRVLFLIIRQVKSICEGSERPSSAK